MNVDDNILKPSKTSEINNIKEVAHKQQLNKITEKMRTDILSGIRQKDFIKKYNLSRQTYINYKRLLIPDFEQIYNLKIDRKEFHEFIKTHNKYDVMLKYKICEATYYNSMKYDREHFDELENKT